MTGQKRKQRISKAALSPMLATLIDAPFDDPDWIFETKWDGYRIVARIDDGNVKLLSRRGKDVTRDYPRIAAALAKLRRARQSVIDGELVALDKSGRSRFQLLQNAANTRPRLVYYVFDLLFLNGRDLRRLPLVERKRQLKSLLVPGRVVRYSRHVTRNGKTAFRNARRRGDEGIMAKRAQGSYVSGRRTREWLKIKTGLRQEVAIVGYTRPQRSRQYFGALVLAVRQGSNWKYVGRAGTGFDRDSLKLIHAKLVPLRTVRKPIDAIVPGERTTIWVRPRLVCEVKFTEWTHDGQMRHPVFVGLRTDKPARSVVRERRTPA
ncbi:MULTISPECIES: non-homologous end-joining DNA ligase [unclassified Bradyrhizobium]|uniref:non-homologous end-joining DNA ligase n=1 Tax=unclassified Bradyrhizobium TaxID=2631580 RepID=UPI00291643F8|nr:MULTISPECIES: non-homologous end-joining DNA ligase [unclassified Bradyrhizobium]